MNMSDANDIRQLMEQLVEQQRYQYLAVAGLNGIQAMRVEPATGKVWLLIEHSTPSTHFQWVLQDVREQRTQP